MMTEDWKTSTRRTQRDKEETRGKEAKKKKKRTKHFETFLILRFNKPDRSQRRSGCWH